MADHYPADGNMFVYTGGRAPHHVINVIIDQSITVIDPRAFEGCLVESVACHDGLESVIDVEFGDKLITIESQAFKSCSRLKRVRMPSVRSIGRMLFVTAQIWSMWSYLRNFNEFQTILSILVCP
eukprot:scaffold32005_cov78-Skeletonema_dohrnii-CCMP3373.AAC.2